MIHNRIFSPKDEVEKQLTNHKEIEQDLVKYYGLILVEPNQIRQRLIHKITKIFQH